MLVPILLAIIGLIVGLGLGFMVAKARHEKEIDGAQNTARGIIKRCWKPRKKTSSIAHKLKVS